MGIKLKEVDGVIINKKHKSTCHCSFVELELDLTDALVDIMRV